MQRSDIVDLLGCGETSYEALRAAHTNAEREGRVRLPGSPFSVEIEHDVDIDTKNYERLFVVSIQTIPA